MKTVICTPAGREKYMRILSRYILSDPAIDRWDIWLNTENSADVNYIKSLKDSKINIVTVPHPMRHPASYRIHRFFSTAVDKDTCYIRLDDDIVYFSKDSISNLVKYRIENPQPFLVYGNIVNNAICGHISQRHKTIPYIFGEVRYTCMDDVGWKNNQYVEKLHRLFLSNPNPDIWKWKNSWELYHYERCSINVISWMGEDARNWSHKMTEDEETWLSCIAPKESKRANVIFGDSCFVHYSFYTQRDHLSKTDILSQYDALSLKLNPAV